MVKFKDKYCEYEISDDFEIKGTDQKYVELLEPIIDIISYDFLPQNGDPFLILEEELKKIRVWDIKCKYKL